MIIEWENYPCSLACATGSFYFLTPFMPELAEVEHSRRQWDCGRGQHVCTVFISRPNLRIFRDTDLQTLCQLIPGQYLMSSEARGKQMLFQFSGDFWLGIHLGMNGELRCEASPHYERRKHDHLVLQQDAQALIFEDKRLFGRVRLHHGAKPPAWWTSLAPGVLSRQFTLAATAKFLQRRRRTPLKAVLLMQEHFPGIGNWMADEILWRASLHPTTPAGSLDDAQTRALWDKVRWVSRTAIRIHQRRLDLSADLAFHPSMGGGRQMPALPHRPGPCHHRRTHYLLVSSLPAGINTAQGSYALKSR